MYMKRKIGIIIITILGFVFVDQLIKRFMVNANMQIIPNILSFNYTKNYGIAFGAKYNMYIILVANLILIVAISFIIIKNFKNNRIIYPLTIVLSGGISNFLDRIINGYVIDYINITFLKFPKFNLADIAIVCGIIFLIIQICRNTKYKT